MERGEWLCEVAKVGILVGLDHVEGQAEFVIEQSLHIREGTENADGTRQRSGIGKDVVTFGRDPVTARCRIVAHGYDKRFFFFRQVELTSDDCRSQGATTGGVDTQDDRFDIPVLTNLADGLGEVFRVDVLLVALAIENLSGGIDDCHLILVIVLRFIRLGIIGIVHGIDRIAAPCQRFQLFHHLILEKQVIHQAIVQGFLGIGHQFQVVGDLVELFHRDATRLADTLKDFAPNGAQQLIHLFAVGFAHLVKEIRFHGALETVVGTADNLHLDFEFFKQMLVEHDLRGHAVQVDHSFRIEPDLIRDRGYIVGALG